MKWAFWIAAAFTGYSYFGYAAWLWIRSRWSPRPVRRGQVEPSVSAVLVARNEESQIARKIENLLTLDYPPEKLEVVVVSDGSSDGTERVLAGFSENPRVRVLLKNLSEGKALGLNDAVGVAGGDILLLTDTRQWIEPGALRLLVENFADPAVGCVSGELMLGDPASGETEKGMGLYWRIEKVVRELESASGSVVGATGAIYCTRRELFAALPAGTLLDDVLAPMQIVRTGSRVIFESRARAWDAPDLGESREFSRKVRTLSGNYQLLQLAPWLLGSKNPIRFEFVSHKLSRLFVPVALVVLLTASAFLSAPFYRIVFWVQVAFYALSLLAIARIKLGPISRLADAARTFVVLNSAAMVAMVNFLTGRKAAWAR